MPNEPIIAPFTSPISAPIARPNRPAGKAGTPLTSASPVEYPLSATTEPTDRSIPPLMMVNVIPMAIMKSSEI